MTEMTAAMLRHAAMNLLAQREYSRKELFRKLGLLSQDSELIDAVLNWLESDRLLSDDRFVEGFIRSRIQKGHGPMRISQDLRQKGVDSEAISLALEAAEADWYELAESARIKKFGGAAPSEPKEKARQIRFLQYRGFPAGVVMALF
ncbi:regulatory protein RecX [Endozoicomonas atrinae]|uniref:regulatory protein RecX n=1 Tax=Endozoicomonas atrinae TaxID=1333660 RepID=UPI000825A24C|nr:regulatory protein RecX [Endozoicomonas atrinae]